MGDALEKLATPGASAAALGDRLWARGNDHLLPVSGAVVEAYSGSRARAAASILPLLELCGLKSSLSFNGSPDTTPLGSVQLILPCPCIEIGEGNIHPKAKSRPVPYKIINN